MYRMVPLAISASEIQSTNVAEESTYLAWDNSTDYVIGDRVYLASTHMIYQAVTASLNISPDLDDGTYWVAYQATNRHRAFDASISTQTANAESIYYQIKPNGLVSHIAFDGVFGRAVRVVVLDDAGDIESDTGLIDLIEFDLPEEPTLTDFLLAEPTYITQKIVSIGNTYGKRIRIWVYALGPEARLARLFLVPVAESFGIPLNGTSIGVTNFTQVELNDFGDLEKGPDRKIVSNTNFLFSVAIGEEASVRRRLTKRVNTETLYTHSLTDQSRGTMVYGIGDIEETQLTGQGVTHFRLEVRGVG